MRALLDTGFLLAVLDASDEHHEACKANCVIAAMAERLNVERILTVDQRHFRIFQPKHCGFFTIVP